MTTAQRANSIWFEGRAGRAARLAILIGILVHLAGFLIFHIVTEAEIEPTKPSPFVSVASSSHAVEELVVLAALSDSEPLFLPTEWNADIGGTSLTAQAHATPFDTFPAELSLGSAAFSRRNERLSPLPDVPSEALSLETQLAFSSFGSDRSIAPVLKPEGFRLELYDFQTGKSLGNYRIDPLALGENPPVSWHFAEFQILVDRTGQIGDPLLTTSSDNEALDRTLSDYLRNRLMADRLPNGYYRVIIGP